MGVNVDSLVKSFLKAGKIPTVSGEQDIRPLEKLAANLKKFTEENKGQAFLSESSARLLEDRGLSAMPFKEITPDYILVPGEQNGEHYILPYFTQYNRLNHEDVGFYRAFDSSFNTKKPDAVPYVFDDIKNLVPARGKLVDNKFVVTKRGSIDFGDGKPIVNQNPNGDPEELEMISNVEDIIGSSPSKEHPFGSDGIPPVAPLSNFTRQQIKYMNSNTARHWLNSSEDTFGGAAADDYLIKRALKNFNAEVAYLKSNPDNLSNVEISELYSKNLLTTKDLLKNGATFQDYFFGNKVPYILGGVVAAAGAIKVISSFNNSNYQ